MFSSSYVFFKRDKLCKAVLWSALGEAYKAKSATEKADGNSKHAIEDIEKSIDAFRHALEIEQDNVWIERILEELSIALTDLTSRAEDGTQLDIEEIGLLVQRLDVAQPAPECRG